jgi:serine/threonine protein phosphatase PrpC
MSSEPPLSFYAVYDGHAGKDAAAFAASHLHTRIISSVHYPTDPVEAIKGAFTDTDSCFLEKGQSEVRMLYTLVFIMFVTPSSERMLFS